MLCEVEFLAVGDASRAGDAIVIRYGELTNFSLMLVDGGTSDTGESIVSHIKSVFGHDAFLEHVVLTHSDADHASGLREVLREIPVRNLWLHAPWHHAEEAIDFFSNKRWTVQGLSQAIKDEYAIIAEIVEIAQERSIPIYFPFQGAQIGPFVVLSPSRYSYVRLLPQFDKTPDPDKELLEQADFWLGKDTSSLIAAAARALLEGIQSWTRESWGAERLKDGGVTSASNESSVVLYADIGNNRRYLLTGDAGVNALSWAADYANQRSLILSEFSFVQIPHHGSRRNVGPSILDRILGPIQPEGTERFSAFVSAPKDDSRHPRKIVLNAFTRRGGSVRVTAGTNWLYMGGFPAREGYVSVERLEIYSSVEEYT